MDLSDGEDPLPRVGEDASVPHYRTVSDVLTPSYQGGSLNDPPALHFTSDDLFMSLNSDVLGLFGERGVNVDQLIEETTVVQACCRKAIRMAAPNATV